MNEHPTSATPADDDDARGSTEATTPIDQTPTDPAVASAVPFEISDDDTDLDDETDLLDQPVDAEPSGDAFRARRKHRRVAALSIAAAVIFTAGAGGGSLVSLALARSTTATSSVDGGTSTQQGGTSGQGTQGGFGGSTNGFGGSSGSFGGSSGGFGGSSDGSSSGSGSDSSASTATAATAAQVTGIVTIVSELGYQDGESAGSGIILTSSGRILTNNHVIDGATSIKVTVQSTGKSYTANVVGTNATQDIAVLQLKNASGLTTATLDTGSVTVGDDVTAVGNANGTGTLSAADGTVTATGQTITTQSEGSTAGETLENLIEIDADVVAGDSGGAVKDSDGEVVGVTTAASSGTSDITGYAIPIATAVKVANQIVAGDDTDEITLGLPAFLGIGLSTTESGTTGAVIGQILDGTPAASTDLAVGDTITKIDGTTISSGTALSKAIATHAVGDTVTITYTDASGDSHTASVTLTEGPAN